MTYRNIWQLRTLLRLPCLAAFSILESYSPFLAYDSHMRKSSVLHTVYICLECAISIKGSTHSLCDAWSRSTTSRRLCITVLLLNRWLICSQSKLESHCIYGLICAAMIIQGLLTKCWGNRFSHINMTPRMRNGSIGRTRSRNPTNETVPSSDPI